MNPMTNKISQMASLLLNSPRLQQMAEQEEIRKRDEETRARSACLRELTAEAAALQSVADRKAEAQQELENLRHQFKPLEDAALAKLIALDEEHRFAQSSYSRKAAELGKKHGEGALATALRRLQLLKTERMAVRESTEAIRYISTPWGTRRKNPQFQEKAGALDAEIAAIEQSEMTLSALLMSEASPHQIELTVSRALTAHGMADVRELEAGATVD
ncbi:MAG: hypothetical protein IV104_03235 [Acidovorax sp.]|nr:hypothetical protein [Acidovorax sp.]